jgi:hypothetical protein
MPTRKMRGEVSRRMSESVAMDRRIKPQMRRGDSRGVNIVD